jgi:RNA polymerase sigma-70 factor, ECF subfamily
MMLATNQTEERNVAWSDRTDGELILLTLDGRKEAFSLLVERYRSGAVRLAAAILGDLELARDASQDSFLKAYRALGTFDLQSPFLPWFYKILRNTCLDQMRRKIRLRSVVEKITLSSRPRTDLRDEISRSDLASIVRQAVSRLKDKDREIIELRHFSDLSYDEISELLGIPRGTVMSRLHYARKVLHDILVNEFKIEAGEI